MMSKIEKYTEPAELLEARERLRGSRSRLSRIRRIGKGMPSNVA